MKPSDRRPHWKLLGLGIAASLAVATGVIWHVSQWRPTVPPSGGPALPSPTVAAVQARAARADLQRATWDELHSLPASAGASDAACLVCHQEVLTARPREASPAGLRTADTLAWYQTLDTYSGEQQSFHWRHLRSPLAQQVMNLSCTFCHQAHDPREESPHALRREAGAGTTAQDATRPFEQPFTLRRTVNTTETCLRCHGAFPGEVMGLSEPWHAMREGLESPESPNGCLTCHAEQNRTVRHRVNYLFAADIERLAQTSSDTCYGCHGGRAWYRISYPYTRHPWPGMPDETPDWAQNRPRETAPRFAIPTRSQVIR